MWLRGATETRDHAALDQNKARVDDHKPVTTQKDAAAAQQPKRPDQEALNKLKQRQIVLRESQPTNVASKEGRNGASTPIKGIARGVCSAAVRKSQQEAAALAGITLFAQVLRCTHVHCYPVTNREEEELFSLNTYLAENTKTSYRVV